MNKIIFLYLPLLFIFQTCQSDNAPFRLQKGDLLFSVGRGDSELLKAIQASTGENKEIPFTHVGIVIVENGEIFVLEATSPQGVVKTALKTFIDESGTARNKPLIAVGRLKESYLPLIDKSIDNARKLLGKRYDYEYDENNDAFYCSELVRFSFLNSSGKPIFEPLPMSFKDPKTGETAAYWTEHYAKLGKPVPENEPGTNPADMSQSSILNIVYKYYAE